MKSLTSGVKEGNRIAASIAAVPGDGKYHLLRPKSLVLVCHLTGHW